MSIKRMNSIRKYISQVVGEDEDQMETDYNFTEHYLSQFPTIESNTIDVLISNGYQTEEALLAFDLKEDLPLLPGVNMAQKSLLRKVLQEFKSNEELESKANDIKGVDEEVLSINTNQLKRKRGAFSGSPSSLSKRSRNNVLLSDLESEYQTDSGLGSRMKQMVSGRKSIRTSTQRNFETEVKPQMFGFPNNTNQFPRSRLSRAQLSDNRVSDTEESTEEEEVQQRVMRGRVKVEKNVDTKRSSYASPIFGSQINQRNSLLSDSLEKRDSIRSPNTRLSRTPTIVKKEKTSEASHVPTPTELEVREHLAKQKALGKSRRGRKQT